MSDPLRDNAFEVLRTAPATPLRDAFEAHLAAYDDAMWRHGPPEHFTASAVVFSADGRQVLLVLHKKARLWLQPGGHFEAGDRTVAGAALREATEESGIDGLTAVPGAIYLHRHDLTGAFGRCTAHWDLRVAAIAPQDAEVTVSEESHDVRWWPVDALPEPTDPDLAHCIEQLRTPLISA